MAIEIANCPADRFGEFMDVIASAFAEAFPAEFATMLEGVLPADRRIAALENGHVVGTAGVIPFRLRVPGSDVAAAGVTMVGVLSTHRRRGILSQMMGRLLDDAYRRGEPLAALWASEAAIYQRFGYGLGSLDAAVEIDTSGAVFARPDGPAGTVRFVTPDQAFETFPAIYARVRETRPGVFSRTPEWWRLRILADTEHARSSDGRLFLALYEADDGPEGYAVYRVKPDWGPTGPQARLTVVEAMAATTRATRDLWRWLLGVDLVGTVRAGHVPADTELLLLVQDPRALRLRLSDGLWLRIVDAAAALAARRYETDGSICLDLRDERCPWNSGRWRLEVQGGKGKLRRSTDEPELALGVAELAAAYLGGFGFEALVRAGRIAEAAPGAAGRATALFRTPVAPWCPEIF